MADKLPTEGAFSAPPPGAPREVTSGSVAPTPDQIAAARANEKELAPFAPKPLSREEMIAQIGPEAFARLEAQGLVKGAVDAGPGAMPSPAPSPAAAVAAPVAPTATPAQVVTRPPIGGSTSTSSFKPPDVPLPFKSRYRAVTIPQGHSPTGAEVEQAAASQETSNAAPLQAPHAVVVGVPAGSDAPKPGAPISLGHQPAASDTDTPSRGIPRPITDPGKKITGGFGDVAQAQYFPLTGDELRHLVDGLLSQIHARLEDDLRFSNAVVYPRVRARVEVVVESYAEETNFRVPKILAPHDKTPLDIARLRAEECVFVLVAERQEMTADGESIRPPDALRADLGLPVPHKHAVETPQGRMLVDV